MALSQIVMQPLQIPIVKSCLGLSHGRAHLYHHWADLTAASVNPFVASPDGYAVADVAGRLPGRGAWVTASEDAIRKADKRGYLACLGGGR